MNSQAKVHIRYALGLLSGLVLAFTGALLGSCRSSSKTVKATHEEHSEAMVTVTTALADTVAVADHTEQSTGETVVQSESGIVRIERDTAGRPVQIRWQRSNRADRQTTGATLRRILYGRRADTDTRADEAASARSDSRTDEKTVTPVATAECKIGWVLVGLVVLYLVYVAIADFILPWIRRR